tara:strand:- start:1516 stop:1641 length:126 start_codon:yes stop_codon:yes gene_type:complete
MYTSTRKAQGEEVEIGFAEDARSNMSENMLNLSFFVDNRSK